MFPGQRAESPRQHTVKRHRLPSSLASGWGLSPGQTREDGHSPGFG